MLVSIENLGNRPAIFFGGCKTLAVVSHVYGQCLASFFAGDKLVKITLGIAGPDVFDDHFQLLVSYFQLHCGGVIVLESNFSADHGCSRCAKIALPWCLLTPLVYGISDFEHNEKSYCHQRARP